MLANVILAYCHLEDARMRRGKAIQDLGWRQVSLRTSKTLLCRVGKLDSGPSIVAQRGRETHRPNHPYSMVSSNTPSRMMFETVLLLVKNVSNAGRPKFGNVLGVSP
jgi:hypothetical protein